MDLIQPIDPTCLDIVDFKRNYGDRICLAGNVANELLRSGTAEDVKARGLKLLETVAPGGGFWLGSGNSVPDWARFDNYLPMRETALDYGWYPIQIASK